jgi:hypothetical protein
MKNLAICAILFGLGIFGPQNPGSGGFDALWMLGLLLLTAYLGQQLAQHLHLPYLVGWVGAGLLLGPSVLDVVLPASFDIMRLVHLYAAIWLGCLTGLGVQRPSLPADWRLPGIIGLSTLAVFLLSFIALASTIQLSWQLALFLAAVASLWGPFVGGILLPRENAVGIGVIGNLWSLALLSVVLLWGWQSEVLNASAAWLVVAFWGSPALGIVFIECLWRLKGFERPQTATMGLSVVFLMAAVAVWQLGFYGLLCGLAAGLTLRRHAGEQLVIQLTLNSARPLVGMVFFSLLGASLDLHLLTIPATGLYGILLIQMLVLVVVRGAGPALWYPLPGYPKYHSAMLLAKGALLFELVYMGSASLAELPWIGPIELVRQALLGDVLVHLLFFSLLAALAWHLGDRPTEENQTPD